jgi:hypothetical protein
MTPEETVKIVAFNQDQIGHIQTLNRLVLTFCHDLQQRAVVHDTSKFSAEEYTAFVASRDSLRGSKDGTDAEYQKNLRSGPIQHHITTNAHHPEYWDARNEPMPFAEVVLMFYDWLSRCLAKGGCMGDFWAFNTAKLAKQPHALAIVEAMRRDLDPVRR